MYCSKCGTKNSLNGLFCKHCGASLVEEVLNEQDRVDQEPNKRKVDHDDNNSRKSNKTVNKNKTINKTVNKEKQARDKKREKRSKQGKNSEVHTEIIHKSSAFQKIVIFFMILIIILLSGALVAAGLYIFQDKTVEVPNVVGTNVDQATIMLENIDLKVKVKKEKVDSIDQNDIVLKQNKKTGEFVAKKSRIVLTVGEFDGTLVDNYVGLSKEEAIIKLKQNHLKYEIDEVKTADSDGYVIAQNPTAGTVLSKNTKIKLTVSKKVEEEIEKEEPEIEEVNEDEKTNE